MVSNEELLAQARRNYGRFLRAVILNDNFFPLELRIGKTQRAKTYGERVAELSQFRATAAALNVKVEWRSVNDPRFGQHERPERTYFSDEDSFLGTLGKKKEVHFFRQDLNLIRAECPSLESWLPVNAQKVVEHHEIWRELLLVLKWFGENPRSGLYLRQLPIEGVDTKFFERNSSILDELLLHVLPARVDLDKRRFEERHGLRWEEALIRLRFLDPLLQSARGFPVADFALPSPSFRALPLEGVTAIVTENLRNFLALPSFKGAVAVFGGGDAAVLLANAPWLAKTRILYWGDMDGRGYAILGRLRKEYGQTESVLMDMATFQANRNWAVKVPKAFFEVPSLGSDEQAALQYLLSEDLRLEQERIPFKAVIEAFCGRGLGFKSEI